MQRVGGEFGSVQGKKESQYVWSVMISVGQRNEAREMGRARAFRAVQTRSLNFILGANNSHLKVLNRNVTSFDLYFKFKKITLAAI